MNHSILTGILASLIVSGCAVDAQPSSDDPEGAGGAEQGTEAFTLIVSDLAVSDIWSAPTSLAVEVKNTGNKDVAVFSIACSVNQNSSNDVSGYALTQSYNLYYPITPGQIRTMSVPYAAGLLKADVYTATCTLSADSFADRVSTNNHMYCAALNGKSSYAPHDPMSKLCGNAY